MKDVFQEFISGLLRQYNLRVFLDALNKCGRPAAKDIIVFFHCLISSIVSLFTLSFSCTPYPNLRHDTEDIPKIIVGKMSSADIQRFIGTRLDHWPVFQPIAG